MNELTDTPEEVELDLEQIEYGASNGLMSPAIVVLALVKELKAALAANREQKAEVERLTDIIAATKESWTFANEEEVVELRAELASLRASVGEKWIDVKHQLPPKLKESVEYLVALPSLRKGVPVQTAVAYWIAGADVWQDGLGDTLDGITHWQPLPAPPTLPTEKE